MEKRTLRFEKNEGNVSVFMYQCIRALRVPRARLYSELIDRNE